MPSSRPTVLVLLAVVCAVVLSGRPVAARASAGVVPDAPVLSPRQASAPPELVVKFEEAAVLAAELTPGGEAVFWSVAREPQGYVNRIVRRQGLAVVDAQGGARFDLDEAEEVPLKAVWGVVDVATGAFAVAAPEGFELREIPFPTRPFEVGAPGVLNRFRHPFDQLHLLVVRPRVGAWELEAWDRSPRDRDGEDDDRVTTRLEDLSALEATGPAPPEIFEEGDVLVVIHPHTLEVFAARIGAPPGQAPKGGGR